MNGTAGNNPQNQSVPAQGKTKAAPPVLEVDNPAHTPLQSDAKPQKSSMFKQILKVSYQGAATTYKHFAEPGKLISAQMDKVSTKAENAALASFPKLPSVVPKLVGLLTSVISGILIGTGSMAARATFGVVGGLELGARHLCRLYHFFANPESSSPPPTSQNTVTYQIGKDCYKAWNRASLDKLVDNLQPKNLSGGLTSVAKESDSLFAPWTKSENPIEKTLGGLGQSLYIMGASTASVLGRMFVGMGAAAVGLSSDEFYITDGHLKNAPEGQKAEQDELSSLIRQYGQSDKGIQISGKITELPKEIQTIKCALYLDGRSSLPDWFHTDGDIYIRDSPDLTTLPDPIFEMPENTQIYLLRTGLSKESIEMIESRTSDPGYKGPTIIVDDNKTTPKTFPASRAESFDGLHDDQEADCNDD